MLPPFFLCEYPRPLAFPRRVGNNPVVSVMRLARGLAILFWLSLPAAAMALPQQEPAASGTAAAQAPAPTSKAETPAASAPKTETTPAETTPAATKKTDNGAASGNRKRRHRAAPAPDGTPKKIVVREGGASEPAAQIAPGMTPEEAARERQNTEQLLSSTGVHLTELAARTLDAGQQETVGQIRNYMDGARSALKDGDVRRADTLATKAHLLAEDLVKH
jgi:hypothetical protein